MDLRTGIGADGFPEPTTGRKDKHARCICVICWQLHGRVALTKRGGYYLSCGICRAQVFLNDRQAIALWRGTQRAIERSPELYDLLSTQAAALAPVVEGARTAAHPDHARRKRT